MAEFIQNFTIGNHNNQTNPLTTDLKATPFAPKIEDSVKKSADQLNNIPDFKSKLNGSNTQYYLQDQGQSVTFQKAGFLKTGTIQEGHFVVKSSNGNDDIILAYVDPFTVKVTLADGSSKLYDGQIAFKGSGANIIPIIYSSGRGVNIQFTPELVASLNNKSPGSSEQIRSQQQVLKNEVLQTANSHNNQTKLW